MGKVLSLLAVSGLGLLGAAALATDRPSDDDWSSYNRTLSSERFTPHRQITRENVSQLAVICTYDTGIQTSFSTGPIVVDGTLYATTDSDTFALDAATCKERWRVHDDVPAILRVNRGPAYLDGRLFRGLQDGRVIALDARTGKRLWETKLADMSKGESVPSALIAWSGIVFAGTAGGDVYGVKGRMYALEAATGKVLWEFYLVPRDKAEREARAGKELPYEKEQIASWENDPDVPITGGGTWTSYTLDTERGLLYVPAGNPGPDFFHRVRPGSNLYTGSVVVLDARKGTYHAHYQLVPNDFHDWDVSAPPVVTTTRSKQRRMLVAPKDGYLYGFNLATHKQIFRTPITTFKNATAPLTPEGVRFCPGSQGGTEWNGPAYDPENNLVYTGTVDWCTTVRIGSEEAARSGIPGIWWTGAHEDEPFGKMDPPERARGWMMATDADTGEVQWKVQISSPVLSGVTPTAGGLVFFGDVAGNLYAFDKANGRQLWSTKFDGALGGGVISYVVGGEQRVAVATGMFSQIWPVARANARIVVLGLKK